MSRLGTGSRLPATVDEAVDMVIARMPERDRSLIASIGDEHGLMFLHHTVGRQIRNEFGLWSGNEALKESCKDNAGLSSIFPWTDHPDSASWVVIVALWRRLVKENKDAKKG